MISGNSYQRNSQLGMPTALNLPHGSFDNNNNDSNLSPGDRSISKNSTMALMKVYNKYMDSGENMYQGYSTQHSALPIKK